VVRAKAIRDVPQVVVLRMIAQTVTAAPPREPANELLQEVAELPRIQAHGGRGWEDARKGMLRTAQDRHALPNVPQVLAKVAVMVIAPSAKAQEGHVQNALTPKGQGVATARAVQDPDALPNDRQDPGKVAVMVIVPSAKAREGPARSAPIPKDLGAVTAHAVRAHPDVMNNRASVRSVPLSTDLPRISEDGPRVSRHDPNATWAPVAKPPRMA